VRPEFHAIKPNIILHVKSNPFMNTMENKELFREQLLEIAENQIRDNNPPEAKMTLKRLVQLGYSDFEAKQLIGKCIALEIFKVIKERQLFDQKRYVKNLNNLPDEPVE
jgi:hypothetical protein